MRSSVTLETLEPRRLMHAGHEHPEVSPEEAFVTSRGTLALLGSGDDQAFVVTLGKGKVVFSQAIVGAEPLLIAVDASAVKRIRIDCGGGRDRVWIAPDVGRRVTVMGGGGSDTIVASAGDTVVGGGGNDKLVVQRLPEAEPTQPVADRVAPEGPAVLSGGAGDDVLFAIASDSVIGGRGRDRVVCNAIELPTNVLSLESWFGSRAVGVEEFELLASTPSP